MENCGNCESRLSMGRWVEKDGTLVLEDARILNIENANGVCGKKVELLMPTVLFCAGSGFDGCTDKNKTQIKIVGNAVEGCKLLKRKTFVFDYSEELYSFLKYATKGQIPALTTEGAVISIGLDNI